MLTTDQTTSTQADRNREAVQAYLGGHRSEILRPDAVFTNLTTGDQWVGPEAIGGMLRWFYSVAFEATVEEPRLIADDHAVVLAGTFAGRHIGEFAGVDATDRDVRVPLVVMYDLVDGEISAGRFLFDTAAFLAQVQGAS
jgi:predicted ester cyclase